MVSTTPTTQTTTTTIATSPEAAAAPSAIKAVVCDIEGTTTSISFVKDVLFVYALANVQTFLDASWDDEATKAVVELLRTEAAVDVAAGTDGAIAIAAADADKAAQIASLVDSVKWQMSIDRKAKPLKTLQGLIWSKAYADGTIKGHVYEDVPKAFDIWTANAVKVYIYSSGSVAAQKLLFGHSEAGDLLPKLSGHYDTEVGPKRQAESYTAIAKDLGLSANEVMFLTDIVEEAKAAKIAQLNVVVLDRPGNAPLTDVDRSEYTVVGSFADISLNVSGNAISSVKRKLDEEKDATTESEVRPSKIPKIDEADSVAAVDVPIVDSIDSAMTVDAVASVEPIPESVTVESTTSNDINPVAVQPTTTSESNCSVAVVVTPPSVVADPTSATENVPTQSESASEVVVDTAHTKTDIDSGDEPKIVEGTADAMDVDMADEATVLNGTANAKVQSVGEEKVGSAIEIGNKAVVDDGAKIGEELKTDKGNVLDSNVVEMAAEELKVEDKTGVDIVESVVDVVDKATGGEPAVEMVAVVIEPIGKTEAVVEVEEKPNKATLEEPAVTAVVENSVNPVEPGVASVPESTTVESNVAHVSVEQNKVVTESASEQVVLQAQNIVKTSTVRQTNETQTVPPEEVSQITNGSSEVHIPISVESDSTSKPTISVAPSPSLMSSTTQTSEVTETSDADAASKEKVSRVEITIEQIEKQPGQTTQTTTHIVKEITIKEQHVVSPTKTDAIQNDKVPESVEVVVSKNEAEASKVGTNGTESMEHMASNGKDAPVVEKLCDDSDKENEVSTTNGSTEAESTPEVKKCASDSIKPVEPAPAEATA